MRLSPVPKIQCTAPMGQPAHDHPIAADDLLTIDAQVLALLARSPGDDQRPGDQGAGVARPAGLNGQLPQIHVIAFQDIFLTGGAAPHLGGHVQHLAKNRQVVPGIPHALGRLR